MNDEQLEDALRGALRREPAPGDFAAKVLAKAGARPVRAAWFQRPMTLAMAAGLATIAIVPSAVLDYQRRERDRGMKAKQDLLVALSITRTQLQLARERIQHTRKAQ